MKAKEFVPASKPRNFVAKNQKTAGAGAHKDKKRAEKQGDVKHKQKQFEQGVAEGANDMTPNWAKYVLDQIYNSDGAITLTDLFDEGIPGLHDMFMATAEAHGLDPEEEFEEVQHELTVELEDLIKGGHEEGVAERIRDPEDWDEGNTEPGNNFAVYINGKKWKVFPGPAGAYADSPEEKREFQRLKDMAARKSAATGKKWEIYITGEPATK